MGETDIQREGRTGSVKLLQRLNKYEFLVEIRVMREGLNNNKWDYRNLRELGEMALAIGENGDAETFAAEVSVVYKELFLNWHICVFHKKF